MVHRRLSTAAVLLIVLGPTTSWKGAAAPAFFRNGDEAPLLPTLRKGTAPRCEREWRSLYWDLFRDGAFGSSRTERAAWVVWSDPGIVRLVKWPYGALERGERWRGAVRGALAILHTHPRDVDPRPSADDLAVARRLGIPVYTIGRDGVFRGEPGGRVVRVADERWFDLCDGSDGCARRPLVELADAEPDPATCGAA